MTPRKISPNKQGAFRVPNSLLQGLTTASATDLNKIKPFATAVLLGLVAQVDAKQPGKEVHMSTSNILDVIEVAKTVDHAVARSWETVEGDKRQKRYRAQRHNPTQVGQVSEALLTLYNQSVVVQLRRKGEKGRPPETELRVVHILDMFGYRYKHKGRDLDLHDLPEGKSKVNVGSDDRPVWRVRRRQADRQVAERPSGVVFRLNKELAEEIGGSRQGIGFTIVARRIFGLLKRERRSPSTVRLLLLVLRQRSRTFHRQLNKLIGDVVGLDTSHPRRAAEGLRRSLEAIKHIGLIDQYQIDTDQDRLRISRNADWHLQGDPTS